MAGLHNGIAWWGVPPGVAPTATPTPTPTPTPTNTPVPTNTPTPTAAPASYRTADLYNYFDVADSNSFSGIANDILNLATTGSAYDGEFQDNVSYTSPDNHVEMRRTGTMGNINLNGGSTCDPLPITQNFTFECGFRLIDTGEYEASLVNWRSGAGIFWSPELFAFQGVAAYTFPTSVKNLYNWTDFFINTLVVAGSSLKLYINGVEEYSTTITTVRSNYSSSATTRYGAFTNGSTNTGGRNIDYSYFRQYNDYALTATEVVSNYNYNAPGLGLPTI